MIGDVRLGIVGLGNIGQQHIRHIAGEDVDRCRITAVASRSGIPAGLELVGVKHYSDYRGLVDSGDCDALLVATPTYNHYEIGEYALRAGLHLLMEKPLGLSVLEAEKLLAWQGADQVFALMLNQRLAPVFATMKSVLEAGSLGALQRTQWTMTNWFRPEVYFQVSDWRATWRGEGGGLLVNQCIHNLDIFQWLCGMPDRITGFCGFGRYHDIEVEDEATAYFEYPNGATGVFVGSTGEAPGVNRLDIVGDRGMLAYDGERLLLTTNTPGTASYNRDTRDMFGQPDSTLVDLTPSDPVDHPVNQHAGIIGNFLSAILDGDALIAPAQEGINSLAMANAILLSAWSGGSVDLPLDAQAYQRALEQRLADSTLREKTDLDVNVDMDKSYR